MTCKEIKETHRKIKSMEIRGAGKIARAAALALKACAKNSKVKNSKDFIRELEKSGQILISARPTAVSLPNAVGFVLFRTRASKLDLPQLREFTIDIVDKFVSDSMDAVKKIGEIGAKRISSGDTLMTHCNSTAAISIIKTAFDQGKDIKVIATESRPWYQGHITVRQLAKEKIPVTLIVDSAARLFMKEVDKVVVGADSIAANGAVVNKIGTSQIALAAHEARALFFVAAESYKFHPATLLGGLIEIEERPAEEVAKVKNFKGVKIRNPAFDITPPEYVDLIVTEKGVIPPQAAISVIKEEYGWALLA